MDYMVRERPKAERCSRSIELRFYPVKDIRASLLTYRDCYFEAVLTPLTKVAHASEAADIETSSADYARRFDGAVGAWMLKIQEDIVVRLLADTHRPTILDVGGGHGQLATPLCGKGFSVTVLGSHSICVQRIQHLVQSGICRFTVGDTLNLPFADRTFDVTLCFRLLTHCDQWRTLVKELCRTARERIIVDYPTSQSLNAIAPMLFTAKKKLEGNTRSWRSFNHDEIIDEFARYSFTQQGLHKQFFLPMALHRTLRLAPLSAAFERLFRIFGLTKILGSPVIADYRRT